MKLTISRPIYFEGHVVSEGHVVETQELHGRELISRGYARAVAQEPPVTDEKPVKKGKT